jgi:hypothetical protein
LTVQYLFEIFNLQICCRIEIKNLGGGKHQLKILRAEMGDTGEWKCVANDVSTQCNVEVGEGEKIPDILLEGPIEGPVGKPMLFSVPYKSTHLYALTVHARRKSGLQQGGLSMWRTRPGR